MSKASELEILREILLGHRPVPNAVEARTILPASHHLRLLSALRERGGDGDIATLLRQAIRHEDVAQKHEGSLRIAVAPAVLGGATMRCLESGLDEASHAADRTVFTARAWRPDWLTYTEAALPDDPLYEDAPRREPTPTPGDPFLSIVRRETYRSPGQREAMRAVLGAPSRSTLVVNLPTGSGKSLCAQVPALLPSSPGRHDGTTLVIVPTVALALDQQRAVADFVPHATAYGAPDDEVARQANREMRARIRDGTQRILFASPESATGSLAECLFTAAERGLLERFVIDEAHIVAQWGDGFRPAFQELPGLRRGLLRVAPGEGFQTVLLTATLTQLSLETLYALFGTPGPFALVSAARLRPEPSYWIARCDNPAQRDARLIEALRYLPRPAIVYTTEVKEAREAADRLRNAGFHRLTLVTGESSRNHRLATIHGLRDARIDLVVATSAFGLGIDQDDVRTVIHAGVPETIDRFYQEVGRAGRDGRASISLVLHVGKDLHVAKELADPVYISSKRGRERWSSLFERAAPGPLPGTVRVDIDRPPSLGEDVHMTGSRRNRGWNLRTLTLMALSGLIELDWEQPPRRSPTSRAEEPLAFAEAEEDEADSEASPDDTAPIVTTRLIRITRDDHLRAEAWQALVDAARNRRIDLARHGHRLMRELLYGQRCVAEILREAYAAKLNSVPAEGRASPEVVVTAACGGCPCCRKLGRPPGAGVEPWPAPPWSPGRIAIGSWLSERLAGRRLLGVFGDWRPVSERERRRIQRLLSRFVHEGIRAVVAASEDREIALSVIEASEGVPVFLDERWNPLGAPPVPTLVIEPGPRPAAALLRLGPRSPVRILCLAADARDPDRPERALADVFPDRSVPLAVLLSEIGA